MIYWSKYEQDLLIFAQNKRVPHNCNTVGLIADDAQNGLILALHSSKQPKNNLNSFKGPQIAPKLPEKKPRNGLEMPQYRYAIALNHPKQR
jgi:hypothetical protein